MVIVAALLVSLSALVPATSADGATWSGTDGAGHLVVLPDDTLLIPGAGEGAAERMRAAAALAPTDRALITTTGAFPDALASGVLQGDAILVGATDGQLDSATRALLVQSDVAEVTILGGTAAVPESVEDDLPAGATVTRLSGGDRTATAAAIAMAAADAADTPPDTVLVARARGPQGNPSAGFVDAIGAGVWSAVTGWPVLLIDGTAVTTATREAMAAIDPDEVIVIGGTAAVSDDAVAELADGRDVRRVAGPERFTTAAEIAAQVRPDGAESVVLLDGTDPEAWTSGFAVAHSAAAEGGAVLLSAGDDLPAATLDALQELGPERLVCGATAAACAAAREAAGMPDAPAVSISPAPGQPLPLGTAVSLPDDATLTDDGGCVTGGTRTGDPAADCTIVLEVPASGNAVGATATATWPAIATSGDGLAPAEYLSPLAGGRFDFDELVDTRTNADLQASRGAVVDPAASELRYPGTDALVPVLWAGFGGAVPVPPDGLAVPVDSARFTRATIRLSHPSGGGVQMQWRSCPTAPGTNCIDPAAIVAQGSASQTIGAGWQTITFDLAGDPSWTGQPVHMLYLAAPAGTVVDDLRLHEPTSGTPVTVDALDGVALQWDTDADPANNTDPASALWGTLSGGQLDPATMPPGRYWLHAMSPDGGVGSTVGPVEIVAPGHMEGELMLDGEWSVDVRGNAWDFAPGGLAAGTDDVIELGNAEAIDGPGLSARNTNHTGDPYLVLDVPTPIDTSVWTHAVVTFAVDGPFDLAFAPGGGTMGRILYQHGDGVWRNGNDIVAYPNQRTYVIDMVGPHSSEPQTPAWQSAPVTVLRFDPNEDEAEGRTWRVESIELTRGLPTRAG